MTDMLREAALDCHRLPTPGKISVMPTKAVATQRDLALWLTRPASPTPAWPSSPTRPRRAA